MIPGDLSAQLAAALQAAVAAGDLPASAASQQAHWRPAPPHSSGTPGTYASALPFTLASDASRDAAHLAESLAASLRTVPWIRAAQVTGDGYLTVTVTERHLAGLAARIVAAGQAAAPRSTALAGSNLIAPRQPELAEAPTWEHAWRAQHDALAGRLAQAAGAAVIFLDSKRTPAPTPAATTDPGQVAAALAYHGADAVRYALAAATTDRAGAIGRRLAVPRDLRNPCVAVRSAHAAAASTQRWAADLALWPGPPAVGPPAGGLPEPLQPELALLDAMSWLPERVAAAARLHRPAELTGHLEQLAAAWLNCRESCPALPFGGRLAPADRSGPQALARVELAAAVMTSLAGGLALLGVSAPARM